MKKINTVFELKNIAKEIRREILAMSYRAQCAHTGGSLSCVEILTALYFRVMRIDPQNPEDENRDRLVFSKAHDVKALYAALALRGFFNKKILERYETDDGLLAGHAIRGSVPGIEISAGSLGHGLPIAVGIALAGKLKKSSFRTFAVLSDGECEEGSTWEAILFAAHHKLDHLIAIIDYNKLQAFGRPEEILNLEPFNEKWRDFGWETKEVNGHDSDALVSILSKLPFKKNKPSVVIAHTIKGFGGVAKYVDQIASQYKPPTKEEYEEALKALEKI